MFVYMSQSLKICSLAGSPQNDQDYDSVTILRTEPKSEQQGMQKKNSWRGQNNPPHQGEG